MAKKNKNIKTGFPGFMKYRENNLSGLEKNAFERELQKDPFASEAEEGLSILDTELLKKDMDMLSGKLKKRITGNRRMIYYRIAASVALMGGLFTIYLLLNRSQNHEIKPAGEPETIILNRPAPISANKTEEPGKGKTEVQQTKKYATPSVSEVIPDSKIAGDLRKKNESDTVVSDHIIASEITVAYKADSVIPSPPVLSQVEDKAVNHEINARAAERSMGGAISKADFKKEAVSADHFPPEPFNGRDSFDNYIQANIRKPDLLKAGKSEVVVLSFLVRVTGSIDSIKVVRSPGQIFSDEAVRLIKEGPKWKPATENGNAIEEEARVRIEFIR